MRKSPWSVPEPERRRRKPPTLRQLMRRQRVKPLRLVSGCLAAFTVTVVVGLAWPGLDRQWPTSSSAEVVRVIDGDTFELSDGERVRIANIDTAEMPPRARCALEEHMALKAKARLEDLVRGGNEISLVSTMRDRDRYGRLLRRVRIDGQDVGDKLVEEGLAQRWRGRKAQWC